MREFRLYPEERRWWSFADYGAVLDVMAEVKPHRVLEFGPGSSTLALIEGGARWIDCCEDDPDWAEVYEKRLAGVYRNVQIRRYDWSDPVCVPEIPSYARFDFALIDGPRATPRRPAVIRYCLDRCAVVMVPREDHNSRGLCADIEAIAEERGLPVEIIHSGPLSGSFAILRPGPC